MANGLFGGGAGTSASPYLIEDGADFNAIRNNVTAYYKMVNYISLSNYSSGNGWTPIPSFTGQLDGNGFGISNLVINNSSADDLGLFLSLGASAVVKNLILKNINISGKSYIGGIAARVIGNSVKIENIDISGTITAVSGMGSVVGFGNLIRSLTIQNCISTCNIVTSTTSAINGGGIAGYIVIENGYSGIIKNCLYVGVMTGTGTNFGPIAGYQSSITSTQNFYDSSITTKTGGIGANLNNTTAKQANSYTNWEVELYGNEYLWIFPQNNYPKLFFDYYPLNLIKVGTVYKKYTSGSWVDVPSITPTQLEFSKNGFRDIYNVSREKWMELLSVETIEIHSYNYAGDVNTTKDYIVYNENENAISLSVNTISETEKSFTEQSQNRYIYHESDEAIALNTNTTYETEKIFTEQNQNRYVYHENDEAIILDTNISYDTQQSTGFGTRNLITALPNAKLIRANGDINLTNVVNIDNFTLTNTVSGSGVLKVIASADSGVTWKTWDARINWATDFVHSYDNYISPGIIKSGLTNHFITHSTNDQKWTVQFDVYIPSSTASTAEILFSSGAQTTSRGLAISYALGSKTITFKTTDRQYSLSAVEMPVDIWFNLAVTFDGVTFRYYVNGSLRNEITTFTTISQSTGNGIISILRANHADSNYGRSTIKNLLVIDKCLSETELKENTGSNGTSVTYLVSKTFSEHKDLVAKINQPWTTIDITNLPDVKTKGMTPTIMNALTNRDWQKLLSNSTTIRFGYYLEEENSSDNASTDTLTLQADISGYWKRAAHGTDYDYEYLSTTKARYSIYGDGTYKINYYNS